MIFDKLSLFLWSRSANVFPCQNSCTMQIINIVITHFSLSKIQEIYFHFVLSICMIVQRFLFLYYFISNPIYNHAIASSSIFYSKYSNFPPILTSFFLGGQSLSLTEELHLPTNHFTASSWFSLHVVFPFLYFCVVSPLLLLIVRFLFVVCWVAVYFSNYYSLYVCFFGFSQQLDFEFLPVCVFVFVFIFNNLSVWQKSCSWLLATNHFPASPWFVFCISQLICLAYCNMQIRQIATEYPKSQTQKFT